MGADGEERTQGNDNSPRTSLSTIARHQHRARAPNWRHGDESQDYRRQVQIVQGPRAVATGDEDESASRHLCE